MKGCLFKINAACHYLGTIMEQKSSSVIGQREDYPSAMPSLDRRSSSYRPCPPICFRVAAFRLTLFTIAVRFPTSLMPLTLWLSWPSRATRLTSLFCARASSEKALCSCGVRRDRFERREFMSRRVPWSSWVAGFSWPSADDGDMLET